MRAYAMSVVGLLAAAFAVSAQENLDTVLRGWEKSMTDLKSFARHLGGYQRTDQRYAGDGIGGAHQGRMKKRRDSRDNLIPEKGRQDKYV